MADRSSETLIALRRIVHALETNARAMAKASSLTQAQLLVLHTLSRNGQEMPRDIARTLGVGQATISLQIDRLEARGLVRRERRHSDRRAIWVILTDAGRVLIDQTPDPLHERFTRRFETLPAWEQAMLLAVSERLASLFDAEDTTPFPGGEELRPLAVGERDDKAVDAP
ncbi:MAG: MarR family transcriptional regulator [Pararhodobacter sp.]|nr:MarR family transcriptional regulator [Pararhodobacter sp.]